jgi:putative addiction module component (TIGR02574 family)
VRADPIGWLAVIAPYNTDVWSRALVPLGEAGPAWAWSVEGSRCRLKVMTGSTHRLLQDVLALSEDERLELASEIIASVDGPRDADWDSAWLAELDRRVESADARGEVGADWTEVRARILSRLGRA